MTLDAEELGRLARKYATLAELRRAQARGEPRPEAAFFRELARAHPGCLRELDTLPLAELDGRAEALAAAAAGGPVAPWMAWISGYHAWWRATLAGRAAGATSSAARPRARLAHAALAALAEAHGVPVEQIARVIFPRGRSGAEAHPSVDTGLTGPTGSP